MKSFILSVFFCILFLSASAGEKDTLVNSYMKQVRELIASKKYIEADEYLLKIFAVKKVLPDEVAFFYGQIQLGLTNYVKAREGFEKYLTVVNNQGELSDQAHEYLDEAEKHICKKCDNSGVVELADSCSVCAGDGKVESSCENCRESGKEFCHSCKGQGVVAIKSSFGVSYKTCQICKGKGLKPCELCNGTGKKPQYCSNCKGVGFFKRKATCNHQ